MSKLASLPVLILRCLQDLKHIADQHGKVPQALGLALERDLLALELQISGKPSSKPVFTKAQKRIADYLQKYPNATPAQIAEGAKVSERTYWRNKAIFS